MRKYYQISPYSREQNCMISYSVQQGTKKTKRAHIHDHYEILYVYPIVREIFVNNDIYYTSSNTLAFFRPGLAHKTTSSATTSSERYILSFTPEFITPFNELFHLNLEELFDTPLRNYSDEQIKEIRIILKKMVNESKKSIENNPEFLILLMHLFLLLKKGKSTLPYKHQTVSFNNILDYINENYVENINLDDICKHFYITKSNLCHKIKSHTGKTFSHFISDIRIEKACILLRTTSDSVNKIANAIGYTDPFNFSKQFKKKTGMSPTEYRKTNNS